MCTESTPPGIVKSEINPDFLVIKQFTIRIELGVQFQIGLRNRRSTHFIWSKNVDI